MDLGLNRLLDYFDWKPYCPAIHWCALVGWYSR